MKMALPGHPVVGIKARVSLSAYWRNGSFVHTSLVNGDRPPQSIARNFSDCSEIQDSLKDDFKGENKMTLCW